jgi:hypothetical protein
MTLYLVWKRFQEPKVNLIIYKKLFIWRSWWGWDIIPKASLASRKRNKWKVLAKL